MARKLAFTVVDEHPTQPYTAQWCGTYWTICDGGGSTWMLHGGTAADAAEESKGDTSDLLKALAITQHESAAMAYIKGGNND